MIPIILMSAGGILLALSPFLLAASQLTPGKKSDGAT